jgi:hypothetical protein
MRSGLMRSGPMRRGPMRCGPMRSDAVRSGAIRCGAVRCDPMRRGRCRESSGGLCRLPEASELYACRVESDARGTPALRWPGRAPRLERLHQRALPNRSALPSTRPDAHPPLQTSSLPLGLPHALSLGFFSAPVALVKLACCFPLPAAFRFAAHPRLPSSAAAHFDSPLSPPVTPDADLVAGRPSSDSSGASFGTRRRPPSNPVSTRATHARLGRETTGC